MKKKKKKKTKEKKKGLAILKREFETALSKGLNFRFV